MSHISHLLPLLALLGISTGVPPTIAATLDGEPPAPEESTSVPPAPTPTRLLVLLSGGPLLVDVRLVVDGQAWGADSRPGRGPEGAPRTPMLESSRSRYYEPRWQSLVWQLLDADENGVLSADELEAAPARLLARDADDDRIVQPYDLESLREQLRSAGGLAVQGQTDDGLSAARFLHAGTDWQLVAAILSDYYAAGRALEPDSFPALGGLFAGLDTDGSGRLRAGELAPLAAARPHVALDVVFGAPDDFIRRGATLRVVDASDGAVRVLHAASQRVSLAVGDERVDLSAVDRSDIQATDRPPMPAGATPDQVRILVHNRGDALFSHLDANHDGRLGEREIAHAPAHLRSLDRNADGKLAASEVQGRMTIAVARGRLPTGEDRYNLPLSPAAAGDVEPPKWFRDGDFNGDGDISRREFVGPLEHFRQLDLNEDGFVSAAEAAVVEVR